MKYIITALCGIVIGALGLYIFKRSAKPATTITIQESIERFKDVGELVVFKVVSRQIVTAETHSWGKFARDWLTALMSTKKMALIIEYGIDFKYDLRSPEMNIDYNETGPTSITMPPCKWELTIRDMKFYDESNARILPWLLGDIGSAIGPGFGEAEKNNLLEEAKKQAHAQATEMYDQFIHEVQRSATLTMEALARSFGEENATITYANLPADQSTGEIQVSDDLAKSAKA